MGFSKGKGPQVHDQRQATPRNALGQYGAVASGGFNVAAEARSARDLFGVFKSVVKIAVLMRNRFGCCKRNPKGNPPQHGGGEGRRDPISLELRNRKQAQHGREGRLGISSYQKAGTMLQELSRRSAAIYGKGIDPFKPSLTLGLIVTHMLARNGRLPHPCSHRLGMPRK